jgi:hypothetical protein
VRSGICGKVRRCVTKGPRSSSQLRNRDNSAAGGRYELAGAADKGARHT